MKHTMCKWRPFTWKWFRFYVKNPNLLLDREDDWPCGCELDLLRLHRRLGWLTLPTNNHVLRITSRVVEEKSAVQLVMNAPLGVTSVSLIVGRRGGPPRQQARISPPSPGLAGGRKDPHALLRTNWIGSRAIRLTARVRLLSNRLNPCPL